jgi:hypothetical protein
VKDHRFLLELPGAAQDVETYTSPAMSVAIPPQTLNLILADRRRIDRSRALL